MKLKKLYLAMGVALTAASIAACNNLDGKDGTDGVAGVDGVSPTTLTKPVIGQTTALIPQAGASYDAEDLLNGASGDTDFAYGKFKALATVGEIDPKNGLALTGYPDGQAAWLKDEETVQVVYQSESYATMSNETYPWVMNSGVKFTGSHIHTIDYDRSTFADFLNNDEAASTMVKGSGELFNTVFNVFGEEVDAKNTNTNDLSAKWGNQTKADGTLHPFKAGMELTEGDFFFHSFCGSIYEPKDKYGTNIGFADDVWLTAEEWNIGNSMFDAGAYANGAEFFIKETMGLASVVVDVANKTAYTVPALGQAGYEKILPLNPGHKDYVVLVMSGYNLNVNPTPLKVYVGKKGLKADGTAIDYNTASERDAFLARNGLLYGQIYGMAATTQQLANLNITAPDADDRMMLDYAQDTSAPNNFSVRYYPTSYRWDGFNSPENAGDTEVYKWAEDGDSGEPNEQPSGYTFFNGDYKVEHPAVDPDITKHRYIQNLTSARMLLGVEFTDLVNELTTNDADNNQLPDYLSADATRIIAGVDGSLTLKTGGKGLAAVGENNADGTRTHAEHVEDDKAYADQPDGLQWIKTADGDYLIVDEDSGNDYGERKYILPINSATMELSTPNTGYLLAVAGGSKNPRAVTGVSAIPDTFSRNTSSEFSGTWNVTHLVTKKADGSFYTQAEIAGTGGQEIIGAKPLAEQTMIGVVQHASESGGIVAERKADQGGQILMFNIDKPLQ